MNRQSLLFRDAYDFGPPPPKSTEAPWEKLYRFFFGDDIFISYSRADAIRYVPSLAARLAAKKHICFFDQLAADASDELPKRLKKKILRSTVFVLIGTRGAVASSFVRKEVELFRRTRRPFIPIDVDGALMEQEGWREVVGLAKLHEEGARLRDGDPSPEVVNLIKDSFRYMRRSQWLRASLIAGVSVVFITAVVSLLVIHAAQGEAATIKRQAKSDVAAANQQVAEARQSAQNFRAEADQAKADADAFRSQAGTAAAAAEAAKADAQKQKVLASKASHEAQAKTRIANEAMGRAAAADDAARVARNDAQEQTRLAGVARTEAERQAAIADSRMLANRSQSQLQRSPWRLVSSVALALEGIKRFPTVEADVSLRRSLALLPRLQQRERYMGDFLDIAPSPDGEYIATLTADNILRVYSSGSKKPINEVRLNSQKIAGKDKRFNIALSNEALYAAVLRGHEVVILDLKTGTNHSLTVSPDRATFTKLTLSPDGKYLAVLYRATVRTIDSKEWYAFSNGALLLDTRSGRVIKEFTKDLGIEISDITFGAGGDLAIGGLELGLKPPPARFGFTRDRMWFSSNITFGTSEPAESSKIPDLDVIGQNAGLVLIWPLEQYRTDKDELTADDFARPLRARIGEEVAAIALGQDYTLFATNTTVWRMTPAKGYQSWRGYEPIAYVPSTSSEAGDDTVKMIALSSRKNWLTVIGPERVVPNSQLKSESDVRVEIWDLSACGQAIEPDIFAGSYSKVSFNPGNNFVAALRASDLFGIFENLKPPIDVFRATDGVQMNLGIVSSSPYRRTTLAVSPDLDFVVTSDAKGTWVQPVWESTTFPIAEIDLIRPVRAAVSRGGRFLLLIGKAPNGNEDLKEARNAKEGQAKAKSDLPLKAVVYSLKGKVYEKVRQWDLTAVPSEVQLTSDGSFATILFPDHTLQIRSVSLGQEISLVGAQKNETIDDLILSPDGRFIAIVPKRQGDGAALVRVWQLDNGREVAKLEHVVAPSSNLVFSPSGRKLLAIDPHGALLLDLTTGLARRVFEGLQVGSAAAFSDDEQYLAISTQDEEIRIFQEADLENEVSRLEHLGWLGSIAFSHDNRYVATALSDSRPILGDSQLRIFLLQKDLVREAIDRLAPLRGQTQ